MSELRKIHAESIPRAISKAERYRLLNEPREAESICKDVLAIDPEHQEASVILLLAITDQFPHKRLKLKDAKALLPSLKDDYTRHYYTGVALERWAKRLLAEGGHDYASYEYLTEAMASYDKAQAIAGPSNEDATLRWNTCARMIVRYNLEPSAIEGGVDLELESFGDEVPTL
jgi:hypothetical protein